MPYSTFSKVYDILVELNEGGEASVEELAERIYSNWPKAKSFTFFRRTAEDRPPIEQACTRRCIRRNIQFAHYLGLVDIEDGVCTFTDEGENAMRSDNYAAQVGTLVNSILADEGFPPTAVERAISTLTAPELPDWETIWAHRPEGCRLDAERFRKLLYLLGRSGNLDMTLKLLYGIPEV